MTRSSSVGMTRTVTGDPFREITPGADRFRRGSRRIPRCTSPSEISLSDVRIAHRSPR